MGGDQRSRNVDARAQVILQAFEAEPQDYKREPRERRREKGVNTGTSGLHRFFVRHGNNRRNAICTPTSKAVPTW